MTGQVPPGSGGVSRFKASGVVGSKLQKTFVASTVQRFLGQISKVQVAKVLGVVLTFRVPQPCPVSPFHPETYRINITPSSTWLISLLILPVTLAIDRPRPIY